MEPPTGSIWTDAQLHTSAVGLNSFLGSMPVSLQISRSSGLKRAMVPPALVMMPITEQAIRTIRVTRRELPFAFLLTKSRIFLVKEVFVKAPPMTKRPYQVMIVVFEKPAQASAGLRIPVAWSRTGTIRAVKEIGSSSAKKETDMAARMASSIATCVVIMMFSFFIRKYLSNEVKYLF